MPRPKAYSLPVTAPFDQWSHLDHGGRCVCRALGSVCVNLPAAAFQEGDETLQAVLQAWPIEEPRLVDSHAPLRRLARLLMHPHSKAICSRKRSREAYVVQRDDVRRARFHRSVYNRDHDSSEVYAERCVFLLEELRCPQHPQTAVGVRVWKVFIDPLWRESRAFGLLMLDGRGEAPRTPVELLQLYSSIGCADMQPLLANPEPWLGLHSPHSDWATQTLLDADKQYVRGGTDPLVIKGEVVLPGAKRPSRMHPLSPELVLSPTRRQALLAGLHLSAPLDPQQREPGAYRGEEAEAGEAIAATDSTSGVARPGASRAPRPHPSDPPQPAPLRFPPAARLWGLQPLADPLTAALPPCLLARLRRAAPPSSQP
jgi:hypothetical protein